MNWASLGSERRPTLPEKVRGLEGLTELIRKTFEQCTALGTNCKRKLGGLVCLARPAHRPFTDRRKRKRRGDGIIVKPRFQTKFGNEVKRDQRGQRHAKTERNRGDHAGAMAFAARETRGGSQAGMVLEGVLRLRRADRRQRRMDGRRRTRL